jgi:hypothetical protein
VTSRPALPLIVSVDTEEDNWVPTRTGITVANIRQLPALDRRFERLGVRATYFTTHQVVLAPDAASIIRGLQESGRAEVGAHLHPWNTAPLDEPLDWRSSMTSNLPEQVQLAKVRTLTDALSESLGARPQAFRAGRFGLGAATVRALIRCGYSIDSSVTPFQSWEESGGPSFVGAPVNAYHLDGRTDPHRAVDRGPLLEIPISSACTRRPWRFWSGVHRAFNRPPLRPLRINGIAARLGISKAVTLSPETDSLGDMLALTRSLISEGTRHLQLFFHSPSLLPGLTPFARTRAASEALYAAIAGYVERLGALTPFTSTTISEAAAILDAPHARAPQAA